MSTLPTLIKLADKKLEAIQQTLNAMEMEKAALNGMIQSLKADIERGFGHAETGETAQGFTDAHVFQRHAEGEQEVIKELLKNLEKNKQAELAKLREIFAEKKQYELLNERNILAAKKARAQKEQAQLDDIANRQKRSI